MPQVFKLLPTSVHRASAQVLILQVQLNNIPVLHPIVGQYVQLKIKSEWGFFSIATIFQQRPSIELHLQDRDGSKYAFLRSLIEAQQPIEVQGPFGKVQVPDNISAILLCRGTGYAPCKAMIYHWRALAQQSDATAVAFPPQIRLVWELDTLSDDYASHELEAFIQDLPDFEADIYVNAPLEPMAHKPGSVRWHSGTVVEWLAQHPKTLNTKSWVYLCASPGRVYQWVDELTLRGFSMDQIASDVFEYRARPPV